MFHNEQVAAAMRVIEATDAVMDTLIDGKEILTKTKVLLLLSGLEFVAADLAMSLESTTHCSACGAELHRACPNCVEWDFDRER